MPVAQSTYEGPYATTRQMPLEARASRGGWTRALVQGIEPGCPVPPLLMLSSWPLAPILFAALVALTAAIALGGLPGDLASPAFSWLQARLARGALSPLSLGGDVLLVILGFVLLFRFSSWSWPMRILVVVGAWVFATYNVGMISWGPMEETINSLAAQPGVDVFEPPSGIVDAGIVLGFFLLLTPVIGLVVLFLLWAWSAFFGEFVRPLGGHRPLPNWLFMVPVVGAFSGVAYAANAVWLPWTLWVLGVVARAYLVSRG